MTTTRVDTTEQILKKADPNEINDAFHKMDLGTMLTPRKHTFTALASAAAQDITTLAALAADVATPALPSNVLNLPPILSVIALRVTAGAAAAGVRTIGDSGATASATVAKLSDDGKTLTFEAAVTAFVLEYIARPNTDMTAKFAPSGS
jgi:hypothetical protein